MNNKLTLSGLCKANFQKTVDGKKTDLFVLKNKNGLELCLTNYGANIVSLMVPDKDGKMEDVVHGHDSIDNYIQSSNQFLGSICGRVAGRIAKATFTIDEQTFTLSPNNGANLLHGGSCGFFAVVWDASPVDDNTVVFTYNSPDGDQGFPGNLEVVVSYTLTDDNEVEIVYRATTDEPTPVNLTNHASFNLSGNLASSIEDHLLTIPAPFYVPANDELLPTGEILRIDGTPMDFRCETAIGERIDNAFDALTYGSGYDSSYVLAKQYADELSLAAEVRHPSNGRTMQVYTTEPTIHLYTGNFLQGVKGKFGCAYPNRSGFSLEAQHIPDSCNRAHFPSTILRDEDIYSQTTVFRFNK